MTTTQRSTDRLTVIPSGGPLGAEVRGVNLAQSVDDATFEAIQRAWIDHQVLAFRGQTLTDRQLIAFSRRFGDLHVVDPGVMDYDRRLGEDVPEIDVISNIIVDGVPLGALGAGEAAWHTDMSMFVEPASATFLYALELPPTGGNTRFASMYRAFEMLSEDLRQRVDGRRSIHDIAYTAAGAVRKGYEPVRDKSQGPGARHPVVRTHPETGRRSLYLGREGYGYILGLPVEESDEVLAALWRHMTRPEFVWEHEWRLGDLVMWDNRCVMHSRGAFDPNARRLLHRTTVKGERPV